MWQPDPGWRPLPYAGSGAGLWLAATDGRPCVVKRLSAPADGDPESRFPPDHVGWWRREAELALEGSLTGTPGLQAPAAVRVDEDESGVTLWHDTVAEVPANGLFRARSLGAFATSAVAARPWHARAVLGQRLREVAVRGGWPTLARTTVADVADVLWRRHPTYVDWLDAQPQVPSHGDPTPANLRGRSGDAVVAVDWAAFGWAAPGADLGYLALSEREELELLVSAYAAEGHDPDVVARAAAVTAVYTAFNRAEWALARVAAGPGALAGKYRHPAVAPSLRTLQRFLPAAEPLL